MKKQILGMAIVAFSLVSVPAAFAQSSKNAAPTVCPEQCETPGSCGVEKCGPAACGANNGQHCRKTGVCAFDGLNLTDAQKAELAAIRTPAQRRAERDKTRRTGVAEQLRTDRAAYLAGVKAVLTPEQYVQFLENSYVNRAANTHARAGKKRNVNRRAKRADGMHRSAYVHARCGNNANCTDSCSVTATGKK